MRSCDVVWQKFPKDCATNLTLVCQKMGISSIVYCLLSIVYRPSSIVYRLSSSVWVLAHAIFFVPRLVSPALRGNCNDASHGSNYFSAFFNSQCSLEPKMLNLKPNNIFMKPNRIKAVNYLLFASDVILTCIGKDVLVFQFYFLISFTPSSKQGRSYWFLFTLNDSHALWSSLALSYWLPCALINSRLYFPRFLRAFIYHRTLPRSAFGKWNMASDCEYPSLIQN